MECRAGAIDAVLRAAGLCPPAPRPDVPRPFDEVLAEWNTQEPPRPARIAPFWSHLVQVNGSPLVSPPVGTETECCSRAGDQAPSRPTGECMGVYGLTGPVRAAKRDAAGPPRGEASERAAGRVIDPPVRPGRLIDLWA